MGRRGGPRGYPRSMGRLRGPGGSHPKSFAVFFFFFLFKKNNIILICCDENVDVALTVVRKMDEKMTE